MSDFQAGDRVMFAPHISPVTRCGGRKAPISMSPYWGTFGMPIKRIEAGGEVIIIQISGEEHDYSSKEFILATS